MALIQIVPGTEWLRWAPLAAACLHITEEFVWPGHFMAWYQRYRGPTAARITVRFLVVINVVLVAACVNAAGALNGPPMGTGYWLAMCALLCANGVWHAWASVRSHSYSPGVITGVLVYVPLAVYAYPAILRTEKISVGSAVIAALIGVSYPVWSALYHRGLGQRS